MLKLYSDWVKRCPAQSRCSDIRFVALQCLLPTIALVIYSSTVVLSPARVEATEGVTLAITVAVVMSVVSAAMALSLLFSPQREYSLSLVLRLMRAAAIFFPSICILTGTASFRHLHSFWVFQFYIFQACSLVFMEPEVRRKAEWRHLYRLLLLVLVAIFGLLVVEVAEGYSFRQSIVSPIESALLCLEIVLLSAGFCFLGREATFAISSSDLPSNRRSRTFHFLFLLSGFIILVLRKFTLSANQFFLVTEWWFSISMLLETICDQSDVDSARSAYSLELDSTRKMMRFISHEVRTPLNTAIMGLDLLNGDLRALTLPRPGTTPVQGLEGAQENAATITDACNIAVGILNELLTYDKMKSGMLQLEPTMVSVLQLIRANVSLFRIQAAHSNLSLVVEGVGNLERSLWIHLKVEVDENKINQVIRNLLSNALKFSPSGSTVTLKASLLPYVGKKPTSFSNLNSMGQGVKHAGLFRLEIIDQGPGISEIDQKKIFHDYVQIDPSILQKGQGSGLGLSISKSIIALHGGNIGMTSQGVGKGSTFFVELPSVWVKQPSEVSYGSNSAVDEFYNADTKERMRILQSSFAKPSWRKPFFRSSRQVVPSTPEVPATSGRTVPRVPAEHTLPGGSTPGAGLTVKILSEESYHRVISAAPASLSSHSVLSPTNGSFTGLNVLIVDDAMTNRKMVGKLLNRDGHTHQEAHDGQELVDLITKLMAPAARSQSDSASLATAAVTLATDSTVDLEAGEGKLPTPVAGSFAPQSCPFDAILVDFQMPRLNGPPAVKLLRAMGYKGAIFGLTGNMLERDIDEFIRAGANDVIGKPFSVISFYTALMSYRIAQNISSAPPQVVRRPTAVTVASP